MFKKIDGYILKTFLGPFIFIFSVLFFILVVQFAWTELEKFAGKGLGFFALAKFLLLMGVTVVQLALPISILLGSIMTFGGLGERYELSALKASSIPLHRIMLPLFFLVILFSIGLFFFQDRITPMAQHKAKNMLADVMLKKPTLSFKEGVFIEDIPGVSMLIGKISGEDREKLTDVFIHNQDDRESTNVTIIAKTGDLSPENNKLRLRLYQGFLYEDKIGKRQTLANKTKNLQNQATEFDTLVQYFDVSELIDQGSSDGDRVKDHYRFLTTAQLTKREDSLTTRYDSLSHVRYLNYTSSYALPRVDSVQHILAEKQEGVAAYKEIDLSQLDDVERNKVRNLATSRADYFLDLVKGSLGEKRENLKRLNKVTLHKQRNFSYSLTCIIFFLIGAPLGAIIRKGGLGMPILVSIVIFVLYWVLTIYGQNSTKSGLMDPTLAAWLGNIVFFPLSLFFTYKAVTDSGIFNLQNYLDPIKRFIGKFVSTKNKEHSRYQ